MSASQKYVTLRGRLDQLGFDQPFNPDSVDLVERLFKSFVKLTEVALVHLGLPAFEEANRSARGKD